MPSAALRDWQNDRMPRLAEIDAHCVSTLALVPPNPRLAEESLRAYVMLLSGHFQGFCRDLYTECGQLFTANVAPAMQLAIQLQLVAELKLNNNNPTVETIRKDFERFALRLDFRTEPANAPRVTHLGQLNKWRNAVAHQKAGAPAGVPPLVLAGVQSWRTSCDELATWLDGIMYNEMQQVFGIAPW